MYFYVIGSLESEYARYFLFGMGSVTFVWQVSSRIAGSVCRRKADIWTYWYIGNYIEPEARNVAKQGRNTIYMCIQGLSYMKL